MMRVPLRVRRISVTLPFTILPWFMGACAAADTTPRASPEPQAVQLSEAEPEPERTEESEREPDPSLRERWRSPFAVSSAGRLAPRNPRAILVVDADSLIAVGVEGQETVELTAPDTSEDAPPDSADTSPR